MGGREEKKGRNRGNDEKGKMKPSRSQAQIKSGSANDVVTEAPIAKPLTQRGSRFISQHACGVAIALTPNKKLSSIAHNKLSCHRETARRFVSLNISLNHPRSLKVIRNDTVEQGVCKSLLIFYWNYVSCTVSQILGVKEWCDLETGGRGRARSLKMVPYESLPMVPFPIRLPQ